MKVVEGLLSLWLRDGGGGEDLLSLWFRWLQVCCHCGSGMKVVVKVFCWCGSGTEVVVKVCHWCGQVVAGLLSVWFRDEGGGCRSVVPVVQGSAGGEAALEAAVETWAEPAQGMVSVVVCLLLS